MTEFPDTDLYQAYQRLSPDQQAVLTEELARRAGAAGDVIPRRDPARPAPCSFAQERLWFLDQVDAGSAAYVMPAAVGLTGSLDVPALAGALTGIVARHEVLRTNFVASDGVPSQVVRPATPFPLPVTDLRSLPEIARTAALAARYEAAATRSFDLRQDPLIEGELLRVADDEHVLLLTLHHIVADGWSLGVLRRELAELYAAHTAGAPPPAEMPLQYADFATWQRDRVGSDVLREQVRHWRDRLAGAPPLELVPDFPRPARRSARGDAVAVHLDAATVRRIDRLAEQTRTTQFMVLLAAFAVTLWRWSGQEDLVIGTPVANRRPPQTEPLVGFFVNTLALRLDLAGDPAFDRLLVAVRRECLAGYANQEVPFERVVHETGAGRVAGEVPLVQVMLALRNTPMPAVELPGVALRTLDVPSRATKFDLSLDLVPAPDGGIEGRAEFSVDLFDPATITRMVTALSLVLDAALAEPGTAISRLPIAAAGEQVRMVEQFSGGGSAAAAADAGTLHGLFEQRVDETPDAVAVLSGDRVLSYRELDEQANRLAWSLRSLGVGPEQIVGVALPRSERMIVAVLGILKAGAGYVPLDPGYPRRRVAYMAVDAGVSLVVTESSVADDDRFRSDGDATGPRLFCLDTDIGDLPAHFAARPPDLVAEPNLAYVIYTSGSTGQPKGSVNEHGRVANTVRGVNGMFGLGPADRMLAISSLNYDMSVYEVFGTLAAGAAIVVPDDIETTDPQQLEELLQRQKVTAWSSAPALLDMLVGHCEAHGGIGEAVLRVVGLGGDRMPPALPQRLTDLVPGVRLLNLAGMTEVSYCSTAHLVQDVVAARSGVPWGQPLPNHRIYVLDRHGVPVPPGVPGELFIGGAGPGRGYWRRPGLTAAKFVPDPYSPQPGMRMYATGDHARFLPGGDLQFLGRLDHQVKIRGFRIEPGEVEGALATHPDVAEPVVLAYADGKGERRLAAYLTTRGTARPSAAELRRFLADRLPAHMVPDAYLLLDRLPLLPSGKLDRAALPEPVLDRPDAGFVPPAGALEEVLAGIWADLLDLDEISATDDFFDLGGHSLLATQAVSRTRDLLRVELTIPGFLAAGTVRELAAHLREKRGGLDLDATARLLLEISAMSDEEAGRLRAE